MSEETVKVTLTIELPKNVQKFLEAFAAFVGISLEDMLKDELETDIESFYQGGYFEGWSKRAFKTHGVAEYFR